MTGKHPLALAGEMTPSEIFSRLHLLWCERSTAHDEIAFQRVISAIPDDFAELFDSVVAKAESEMDNTASETTGKEEGQEVGVEDAKEDREVEEEGHTEKEKGTNGAEEDGAELLKISPMLRDLISRCLVWNPKFRLTAEEVLRHPFFQPLRQKIQEGEKEREWETKPILRCTRLPDVAKLADKGLMQKKKKDTELLTLGEVFHFWKLLGGNVEEIGK